MKGRRVIKLGIEICYKNLNLYRASKFTIQNKYSRAKTISKSVLFPSKKHFSQNCHFFRVKNMYLKKVKKSSCIL